MDDTTPLGIFLVVSGSKGDRLLFRYPYNTDENRESNIKKNKNNPYALVVSDDHIGATRFPDEVLAKLFACKPKLCGEKFELKVKDVRFVGQSILLKSKQESNTELSSFHLLFALRACADHQIVDLYYSFARMVCVAIEHEEYRLGLLTSEARMICSTQDDAASCPEGSLGNPYHLIQSKSLIASDILRIFKETRDYGEANMKFNGWIIISYCVPNKVHRKLNKGAQIEHLSLLKSLSDLAPYYALLLLMDPKELIDQLPLDASPALIALANIAHPFKSLQTLSLESELSLLQVFQIAAHMIYWGKAIPIFPMCEKNTYILAPNIPTQLNSYLVNQFEEAFPNYILVKELAVYAEPFSISSIVTPNSLRNDQKIQIDMLIWMLQRRLLLQIHTYVYLQTDINFWREEKVLENSPTDSSVLSSNSPVSYQLDIKVVEYFRREATQAKISESDQEYILKLSPSSNPDDLRNFAKLCKFFNGKHHFEEIMYIANISRTELINIIEKYQDILLTVQKGDPVISSISTV